MRDRLTVRLTDVDRENLGTLTATGLSTSAAIRLALDIAADMYSTAWRTGAVPRGQRPDRRTFRMAATVTTADTTDGQVAT